MTMYNKIFTTILDSSIWAESETTRIVWVTFIAAMDETGFARFAAADNVANRARVPLKKCEAALAILEGPDQHSSDPSNEGRRIERVPGGWMVLNSEKYRHMVTRAVIQEQTRERVRRFREKRKTEGNAPVTQRNAVKHHQKHKQNQKQEKDQKQEEREREPALDGKLLDDIACPQCGRKGNLRHQTAHGSHASGFWCHRVGGCGFNFPSDYEPIVSQMTPGGREAVLKAAPKKSEPYVSPGMILTSLLKYDEKGMLIE